MMKQYDVLLIGEALVDFVPEDVFRGDFAR